MDGAWRLRRREEFQSPGPKLSPTLGAPITPASHGYSIQVQYYCILHNFSPSVSKHCAKSKFVKVYQVFQINQDAIFQGIQYFQHFTNLSNKKSCVSWLQAATSIDGSIGIWSVEPTPWAGSNVTSSWRRRRTLKERRTSNHPDFCLNCYFQCWK